MPDGDIVNSNLKRCYQKSYKMICEGARDITECAGAVLIALKKEIQRGGNSPFELAKVLSYKISENSNLIDLKKSSLLKEILRKEMRESRISVLEIGRLENSVNNLIHNLRYNNISTSSNFHTEIINNYFNEWYKSSFAGKINSTSKHYKNSDHNEILYRMNQMNPIIKKTLNSWTNTIIKDGDVKKLRQLRTRKKKINLDENLL